MYMSRLVCRKSSVGHKRWYLQGKQSFYLSCKYGPRNINDVDVDDVEYAEYEDVFEASLLEILK